jgi:hypothetical protein
VLPAAAGEAGGTPEGGAAAAAAAAAPGTGSGSKLPKPTTGSLRGKTVEEAERALMDRLVKYIA